MKDNSNEPINPNDGTFAAYNDPNHALKSNGGPFDFVISYTRKMAIADGVLIEMPAAAFVDDGREFMAELISKRVNVCVTNGLIAAYGGREVMDAGNYFHWKELIAAVRANAVEAMNRWIAGGPQPTPDLHWTHYGVEIYCLNHEDEEGNHCLTFMLEGED